MAPMAEGFISFLPPGCLPINHSVTLYLELSRCRAE